MRGAKPLRTDRARRLRQADNGAEARLWHALRNRQLNGRKFVRQFGIGPYFADFACRESLLVVELDGSQHIANQADEVRTQYLNAQGWSVARFWNASVLQSTDAVLDTIAAVCDGVIMEQVLSFDFQYFPAMAAPHPNPLPAGGERGFMAVALLLALKQMGRTWPNPAVGCVIVKDGVIIAEGATGDGGRPHAEEIALDKAGETARGSTAYVTLEPCGQRSNGGCSCSQRLVEAQVARMVYACDDPSPFASNQGPKRLCAAGIAVESGLMANEARQLIAPTAHYFATGLPMVQTSETGQGFDAAFTPMTQDLPADLKALADQGYRHLFVVPGSDLASRLDALGLLTH